MSASARTRKTEEPINKAAASNSRATHFDAERAAEKALAVARQDEDFARMARVVDQLLAARRQRVNSAMQTGKLMILDTPFTDTTKIERGCYLVQPPQVGSEARRLRLEAFSREIPVVVLCREPLTRTSQVPVVAISPGSTLRTKVPPPSSAAKPDLVWFAAALEELGDWAIESLDPALAPIRRIDALLDAIDALPDHIGLHDALKEACQKAAAMQAAGGDASDRPPSKSKIKS